MSCRECGREVPQAANFCPHCGVRLDHQAEVPAASVMPGTLERRQLTIMFCDLVNSTVLAEALDPEAFGQLIEAYRGACVAPIARYDGLVAQFVGDGILVYFGFPLAHEDDPDRAVRAGLEMILAVKTLDAEWRPQTNVPLAVRIGINTGVVVVGDLRNSWTREDRAVFGQAVNVASRLQNLAGPNAIILSAETRHLLRGAIRCRPQGRAKVKGVTEPIEVFEVESAGDAHRWHWDGGDTATALSFVGREADLARLENAWDAARHGHGQAVLLLGEAGVGKSRFIRAVKDVTGADPSADPGSWLATGTSPYARNTEFFAFAELIRRDLRPGDPDTELSEKDRLRQALQERQSPNPDLALGLGAVLDLAPEVDQTTSGLNARRLRSLAIGAVRDWLVEKARHRPVVLVIEDLHWADASTLEVIDLLLVDLAEHQVLLILSSRSAPNLERLADVSTLTLDRLATDDAEKLLRQALGQQRLSRRAFNTLIERADGLPLFLEELPKSIAIREPGDPLDDAQAGSDPGIPTTLRDSLMSRLDRMGRAKTVAQIGAVLGHRFDLDLLNSLWDGPETTLRDCVDTLIEASVLIPSGEPTFRQLAFRHALIEEIAYDSLLRQDRRRYHRLAAQALEARGVLREHPEILAWHFSGAGRSADAFAAWLRAGKESAQRAAYQEALSRMNNAENALKQLVSSADDPSQDPGWLDLLTARAPVLSALYGRSEDRVDNEYRNLLSVARRSEANQEEFYAWRGICNLNLLRGNLASAFAAATETHRIAVDLADTDMLLSWHRMLGLHDFLAAKFVDAVIHERAGMVSTKMTGRVEHRNTGAPNPTVSAGSISAWALWFSGECQLAAEASSEAMNIAEHTGEPVSKVYAHCLAASLAQCRNDVNTALSLADTALDLSDFHELPYWRAWAMLVKGWSIAVSQSGDLGLTMLDDGFAEYQATGAAQMKGYGLCLQADGFASAGRWDRVLEKADAAILEMRRSGIVFYAPEAMRLKGEALEAMGWRRAGLAFLLRGLRIASRQRSIPMIRNLSRKAWSRLDQTVDHEIFATGLRRIERDTRQKTDGVCQEMTNSSKL